MALTSPGEVSLPLVSVLNEPLGYMLESQPSSMSISNSRISFPIPLPSSSSKTITSGTYQACYLATFSKSIVRRATVCSTVFTNTGCVDDS
jgi:hypothetical protein